MIYVLLTFASFLVIASFWIIIFISCFYKINSRVCSLREDSVLDDLLSSLLLNML